MKSFLALALLCVASVGARAQFGWDEEPLSDPVQAAIDRIDNAFGTPFIEPPSFPDLPTFNPRPVTPPPAAVFQPFVSPVVDVDPLVEQCDLEPEVAQVYRQAEIADDEDCPEHRSAGRSGWSPLAGPGGRHERERRSQYLGRLSANPYATDAPDIVAQDGTYLGKLSANPYDPDSVSNPYGRYGSPYSSTSINNPYSTYGSPYSSQSPNNPYATQAALLFGD